MAGCGPGPRGRAFTLVEMMVAMAFLSAIILIVARVLAGVSDAWEMARRRTETAAAARLLFDLIHRDLAAAAVEPGLPMVVGDAGLRFHTHRPVADPDGRDGYRTLIRADYALAAGVASPSATAAFRRRQADWETGRSAPDAGAPWEELYPYVRAFRVKAYQRPGEEVSGTLTSMPAYLDLYLELASPDDAAVLGDMVAERRERVVQRFAMRMAPGAAGSGSGMAP